MSNGINMNAKTEGFPVQNYTVAGWSVLVISTVSSFNVVAEGCKLYKLYPTF